MYSLYPNYKRRGIILMALGIIGSIIIILLPNIVNIELINIIIMAEMVVVPLLMALIIYGIHTTTIKPYDRLYKLYEFHREIQVELEDEFKDALNLENKIWVGTEHLFCKTTEEFKVFKKKDISNILISGHDIKGKIVYRFNAISNNKILFKDANKKYGTLEIDFNSVDIAKQLRDILEA